MSEPESTNTMFHDAFTKLGDGSYALQTTGGGGGGATDVNIASSDIPFYFPVAESGFGSGSVTAPAAGATIATHQPPAGATGKLHKIIVTTWLSGTGTPAEADNMNMAFKYGTTIISNIPVATTPITTTFYFKAATGVAFSVVAVAAGTADVTYNAMLVATQVQP